MVTSLGIIRQPVVVPVENYPEAGQRQRIWVPMSQAQVRIEDAGLRDIVRGVAGTP